MVSYNVLIDRVIQRREKAKLENKDAIFHQAIDEKRMEEYGERRKGRGRRGELRRRKGILLVSW